MSKAKEIRTEKRLIRFLEGGVGFEVEFKRVEFQSSLGAAETAKAHMDGPIIPLSSP